MPVTNIGISRTRNYSSRKLFPCVVAYAVAVYCRADGVSFLSFLFFIAFLIFILLFTERVCVHVRTRRCVSCIDALLFVSRPYVQECCFSRTL